MSKNNDSVDDILGAFSYDFLENALVAFVQDIQLWFKPNKIPAFIANSGDEVYIIDQNKMNKATRDKESLYNSTPRVLIDVGDVGFIRDEMTSPNVSGKFVLDLPSGTREYKARLQRIPMVVQINLQLVNDNLLSTLKYIEIMTKVLSKTSTFGFTYLGKVYNGSYVFDFSVEQRRNITLGYDSTMRHRTLDTTISLQLQYPNFNVFRKSPGFSFGEIGAYGNGLADDGKGNQTGGLVLDPEMEDITDPNKRVRWVHTIEDVDKTFKTQTVYDGESEIPIPNHQTIKPS